MRILIFLLFSLILLVSSAQTNPFSSKLDKRSDQKENFSSKRVVYKGYIFFDSEKYAIVQIGDKQHTLKKGQKIKTLEIIKISPKTLQFKLGGILLKTGLEKNNKTSSNETEIIETED